MSNTLFDGNFTTVSLNGWDPGYYPSGSQWGFQNACLMKNPTGPNFSGSYNVAVLDPQGLRGQISQNFTVSQNGNYTISFTLQGTRDDLRYSCVGTPVTINAEVYGSPTQAINQRVTTSSGSAQTFTFNLNGLVANSPCSLKLMDIGEPGDSVTPLISNIHVDFVS